MKFYEDLEAALSNLSDKGAFLTVKSGGRENTMTISWGYVGFSWGKPYFITLVRPQRFTHDLLETADSFTISIPYNGKKSKELAICGTKSGRDCDKAALAGIEYLPGLRVATPVVAGCDLYYECKLEYVDTVHTEKLPPDVARACYNGDTHDLYFGEIVETYKG
jgi:flavin reductase (DIM6/NTAB) family NADH-FMN oxidoreductase RutF